MRIYQNYHRHSSYSNPIISDSVATNQDYAKRAVELGHGIISTMEHGYQGRYIEGYEASKRCFNFDPNNKECKQCGGECGGCERSTSPLKFVFGAEAYWVKNRHEKDGTNSHICIFAKNENGRQAINDILSEANISGFYKHPRIDLDLIYTLPPDDVIVTTACIAFWKYKDIDDIVYGLHLHFKNNFYLEVQYHHTEAQRQLNQHISFLAQKYNIGLIMGCDSHYIDEARSWERDDYLLSKNIHYKDEEKFFLDYPDGDTAYQRFIDQGVLTEQQINEAFDNTNIFLNVEEYHNPCFTKDIKMTVLPEYQNLSIEQRNKIYSDLIDELWEKEKNNIPSERHTEYEKEIKKEKDIVIESKHSDYFLFNYKTIKESIKKGGQLTNTGRGSAVSFFTNKLLGFTKVDRIAAKIKMYPERFMSAVRILKAKTLADIDFNVGNPEIFAETQKKIIGKECSYPMIAYGEYQKPSAFKMFAKAKGIPFEVTNEITKQLKQYERDLNNVEEDEKDQIHLFDYVDEKYHKLIDESSKYLGIISSWSPHPCAHLVYQGNIRKEIGLVMMRSNQGKKLTLCCLMDGLWAEKYKFLKNDFLKVSVVQLIKETYKDIGIEEDDITSLLEKCEYNQKVNDIYKKGYTLGINQVAKIGTKKKMMIYQSQNITELTAFIAAIRPAFKTMFNIFQSRQHFDYGIKVFDDIIQTSEMKSSFILYQEMIMSTLNFANIPLAECYDVIKSISKKRGEKILPYKNIFISNFSRKIIELEHKTEKEAIEISQKIWQIILDSAKYGFNASHAYCVALDSLYCAYLKAYYPLNFYRVFLNILNDSSKKDDIIMVVQEMKEAFDIELMDFKFRQDNRSFSINYTANSITGALKLIKGIGDGLAEQLYTIGKNQYDNFTELLIDMIDKNIICKNIPRLISIDYFSEFGKPKKLLNIYNEVINGENRYNANHKEQTKKMRIPKLIEYEKQCENLELSSLERLTAEINVFGEPRTKFQELGNYVFVKDINKKYSPKLDVITIKKGIHIQMKMTKFRYNQNPIAQGDVIKLCKYEQKTASKYIDGKYKKILGRKEWWIDKFEKVNLTG